MNQLALNRPGNRNPGCVELLAMAQRELAALFRAVTDSFGPEQAELSAEDWLHEVETSRTLPTSPGEWRRITTKVIIQLGNRVAAAIPATAQLQPAGY